jgi:hypothetical protein
MTLEELHKEFEKLAKERNDPQGKKMWELMAKFLSSEENVDKVFGALAKTAFEHDK